MGSREIWDHSSRMRGVWGQLGLCAEPENLCEAQRYCGGIWTGRTWGGSRDLHPQSLGYLEFVAQGS